jgi:hypothetical protein
MHENEIVSRTDVESSALMYRTLDRVNDTTIAHNRPELLEWRLIVADGLLGAGALERWRRARCVQARPAHRRNCCRCGRGAGCGRRVVLRWLLGCHGLVAVGMLCALERMMQNGQRVVAGLRRNESQQ